MESIKLDVNGNLSMSHVLCFIIDIIIILSHILILIIIFVIIVLIIAMIINNAVILIITLIEKGIIFYFIIINLLWSKWNQVKRNVTFSESSLASFCLLLKWSCPCLICKFNNWLHHIHVSKLISWVCHLLKFRWSLIL